MCTTGHLAHVLWAWTLVLASLQVGRVAAVEIYDPTEQPVVLDSSQRLIFVLSCRDSSEHQLSWYKDSDEEAISSDYNPYMINEATVDSGQVGTELSLVRQARKGDAGVYRCRSTSGNEDTITVTYEDPDQVTITIPQGDHVHISVNDRLDIHCQASLDAALEIRHNGNVLVENSNTGITITRQNDVVNDFVTRIMLSWEPMRQENSGNFECVDRQTGQRQALQVEVTESRGPLVPVKIFDPSDDTLSVRPGQSFTLRCMYDQNADIRWYQGETALVSDTAPGYLIAVAEDHERQVHTSMLTKEDTTQADSGVYSCRNTHEHDDRDQIHVTVEDGNSHKTQSERHDLGDGEAEGHGEDTTIVNAEKNGEEKDSGARLNGSLAIVEGEGEGHGEDTAVVNAEKDGEEEDSSAHLNGSLAIVFTLLSLVIFHL